MCFRIDLILLIYVKRVFKPSLSGTSSGPNGDSGPVQRLGGRQDADETAGDHLWGEPGPPQQGRAARAEGGERQQMPQVSRYQGDSCVLSAGMIGMTTDGTSCTSYIFLDPCLDEWIIILGIKFEMILAEMLNYISTSFWLSRTSCAQVETR